MTVEVKDKEGNVVAEVANEEEAFWTRCERHTKSEIKGLEDSLKFQRAILEMIQEKREEAAD